MAVTTFAAKARWEGGLAVEAEARGHKVRMDEPKDLGGADEAMNPVEMVLSALGGCVTICAAAFAPACGVNLLDFRVDVEGDLDPDGFLGLNPDVRTGFQDIRFKMYLKSDSSEEKVQELIKMIEDRCPVSDTLSGVEVRGDFEVEKA